MKFISFHIFEYWMVHTFVQSVLKDKNIFFRTYEDAQYNDIGRLCLLTVLILRV